MSNKDCGICPLRNFFKEVPPREQGKLLPKSHKFCAALKQQNECMNRDEQQNETVQILAKQ